jgi:ElaB/YqjD/DUF883 family membrane-anchored ribosome-binding protein
MELYYKDLISEEASLEKLVDDLMLLVQGADAFAKAAGVDLSDQPTAEIASRLERLKASCLRVKEQARTGMVAMDKLVRQHPYSAVGFAFGLGILATTLLNRRR